MENNIVYFKLNPDDKPAPEQIEEIRRACLRPPVYDEENPPITKERLKDLILVDPATHKSIFPLSE